MFVAVAIIVGIPMSLESKMKKTVAAMELDFKAHGFKLYDFAPTKDPLI